MIGETYEVREYGPAFGVMATTPDGCRALGIDFHWLSRDAAERALRTYEENPGTHGKLTEAQALGREPLPVKCRTPRGD